MSDILYTLSFYTLCGIMPEIYYSKNQFDLYVLHYGDNEQIIGEEVAIAFDDPGNDDMMTLLKHGTKENVSAYLDKVIPRYREAGLPEMADQLKMISGKFDVEELNRVIDTTGYLKRFMQKHGIELTQPIYNNDDDIIEGEQMSKWEELMERDSTMEEHVARFETGEATSDDLLMMAADSTLNGVFTDAADYILKAAEGDYSMSNLMELTDQVVALVVNRFFVKGFQNEDRVQSIKSSIAHKIESQLEEMEGSSPGM